jgi:hypothetical protein
MNSQGVAMKQASIAVVTSLVSATAPAQTAHFDTDPMASSK